MAPFGKSGGIALLARWTTCFDCGHETNWWYVVKDEPFDINAIKAKRCYEINKGKKNFTVKRILPHEYQEDLYQVTLKALEGWPEKYRPIVKYEAFIRSLQSWNKNLVYGAFLNENKKLCGYAYLTVLETYMDFNVLRTIPEYEKKGINVAIIGEILKDYKGELQAGKYICDGSRSIRHGTAFQDHLEKYFGFRKAYCKLNIRYRKPIGIIIACLYPLRKKLERFDHIGMVHQINAILKMEEFIRE